MALSLAVVCEAPADQLTACDLADRVLCDEVDWITWEVLKDYRTWRGETEQEPFLQWDKVWHQAAKKGLRRPQGFFGNEPGAADAHVARMALLLLNSSPKLAAVLFIRDDDRNTQKRQGLEQARQNSKLMDGEGHKVPIIIGLAHPRRESWVLAGFVPKDTKEEQLLEELCKRLTFHPCQEPHRLNDKGLHEPRSAKHILSLLTQDNHEREATCWRETAWATLEARGEDNGLVEYLSEVRTLLVPLFDPSKRPRAPSDSAAP
jgi:hypothetical protein